MSNPLVAPSFPLTQGRQLFAEVPQAYFTPEEVERLGKNAVTGKSEARRRISIEQATRRLDPLDMEKHVSFFLGPENRDNANLNEIKMKGKVLARAQMGSVSIRSRTSYAMTVAGALYTNLVDWRGVTKEAVKARAEQVVFAQAGTRYTLGRLEKYYPKKGSTISKPVTNAEAAVSMRRCGLITPEGFYGKPFVFQGEGTPVSINPEAENGYPIGGKWKDEFTQAPILQLAAQLREKLVDVYKAGERTVKGPTFAVGQWKRQMEDAPETLKLMALKGKCKADPYKKAKVLDEEMRFYNVVPRQVLLNMLMVTQPMDNFAAHIGSNVEGEVVRSAIGQTLTRGGAEKLIEALDVQLARDGYAYSHVGDDSFVALRVGARVLLFSIDCSSFDLTQHGDMTAAIHTAFYKELRKIDGPAAALWYSYARSRCCVVVNSQVYRMNHAGPSGMPLQSKVNDVIMDVYLRRLAAQLAAYVSDFPGVFEEDAGAKSVLNDAMQEVGQGMGLVARLEDFISAEGDTIKDVLATNTFLYVGYNFYSEGGRVYVFADMVRQLGQMQYPNSFWVEKNKLLGMEAVRLAGILISFGRPPEAWRPIFQAARQAVAKILGAAMRMPNTSLGWLPENAFVGVSGDDVRSLEGLMGALMRDPDELWGFAGELEADTYLVGRETVVDGPILNVPALRMLSRPTHPLTDRNFGRPPPVARWGPDKFPRYATVAERTRGLRRAAGDYVLSSDMMSEGSMSDLASMDSEYYGFGYKRLRGGGERMLWGNAWDWHDEMRDDRSIASEFPEDSWSYGIAEED